MKLTRALFYNPVLLCIPDIEAQGTLVQRHCECQRLDPSLLGGLFDSGNLPVSRDNKTTNECCTNGIIEIGGQHEGRCTILKDLSIGPNDAFLFLSHTGGKM
ncbi:hypothetical protein N0V93_005307 [Gnomoniopsis smithogilvyi]|uniref:Uncharacterized protein n=1 Tax=Gnomoniopsis smithogilvyi TaxID=1191159 RepID=A0A9W8YSN1_9PEZI|nr:hypothetical protein N0V93_005307 [Gnomoniopsis smithogilvyi]